MDKTKISITCLYQYYEVKTKMVKEQRLQLKMKVLLGYSIKNI